MTRGSTSLGRVVLMGAGLELVPVLVLRQGAKGQFFKGVPWYLKGLTDWCQYQARSQCQHQCLKHGLTILLLSLDVKERLGRLVFGGILTPYGTSSLWVCCSVSEVVKMGAGSLSLEADIDALGAKTAGA